MMGAPQPPQVASGQMGMPVPPNMQPQAGAVMPAGRPQINPQMMAQVLQRFQGARPQ